MSISAIGAAFSSLTRASAALGDGLAPLADDGLQAALRSMDDSMRSLTVTGGTYGTRTLDEAIRHANQALDALDDGALIAAREHVRTAQFGLDLLLPGGGRVI